MSIRRLETDNNLDITCRDLTVTGNTLLDLSIGQLSDVDTSTPPTVNQVLKWDGVSSWKPETDTVGSGTVTAVNGILPDGLGDVTQYLGDLGNVITDGTVGSILRISAPGIPG